MRRSRAGATQDTCREDLPRKAPRKPSNRLYCSWALPAIHVQDLWSLEDRGSFAAVGTGIVKVKKAVQAAIDTGVGRVVVEQDRLRNLTAFDTIMLSSLYLEEAELMWRLV